MVRGEPKNETELKAEHHRKDHEKYLKAKTERLDRHSGECALRNPEVPWTLALAV